MSDISKLKQRLNQIEAQKQAIRNEIAKSSRSNATSRKIEIGVHLVKLAESDADAYATLVKVWAAAQAKRPAAFTDCELPPPPKNEFIL